MAKAEADERFVIPPGAHWNDMRAVPKEIGRTLKTAMRAIEAANPGRFDGICRTQKPPERQGRVLFIDAIDEIARERAYSFLRPAHQATHR